MPYSMSFANRRQAFEITKKIPMEMVTEDHIKWLKTTLHHFQQGLSVSLILTS